MNFTGAKISTVLFILDMYVCTYVERIIYHFRDTIRGGSLLYAPSRTIQDRLFSCNVEPKKKKLIMRSAPIRSSLKSPSYPAL